MICSCCGFLNVKNVCMQSFRISNRCSILAPVFESSRSWPSDSCTVVSARCFRMKVKSDVTSKKAIISLGWMVVFLSFAKKCSADLTVVGECRVRGFNCLTNHLARL